MIFLLGAVVLYIGVGVAIYTFQRTLLYFPFKTEVAPISAGLPEAEVHRLRTTDGETLVSWFAHRPGSYLAIYFHGNGGSLSARADRIRQLLELGFSVLAVDYRGYGGSTGSPTEAGLHIDADATYDAALKLGFTADHIVLLGESLGSGVALELATRRQVAGLSSIPPIRLSSMLPPVATGFCRFACLCATSFAPISGFRTCGFRSLSFTEHETGSFRSDTAVASPNLEVRT